MKRDINFIRHIKPQIKKKEKVDKATSRQIKYERVCRAANTDPYPAIDIEDLCIAAKLIKMLKGD